MLPHNLLLVSAVSAGLLLTGCAPVDNQSLTIYSGRSEELIAPLIEKFEQETGVAVEVRYAGTAELAAQLLEEGENTPADLFLAQDAGALGALSGEALFVDLPAETLELVDPAYRSAAGDWVGLSGRARVMVFDPSAVNTIPKSVLELADSSWAGKVGIAPGNASFQAFVTALRLLEGEDAATSWLAAMKQNAVVFENNNAILDAVESGQISLGLINHYYWHKRLAEVGYEALKSRVTFFEEGDAGNLINIAGIGMLQDSENARTFVDFLLSAESQQYFVVETAEYPLLIGADTKSNPSLLPLVDLPAPEIDLGSLADLQTTLDLIRAAGLL
jgi:iron(III) transport system substrate-binding protein